MEATARTTCSRRSADASPVPVVDRRADAHLLAAMTLASTPDALQRVLEATLGEHYRVKVREGPEVTVGLWRRG